MSYLKLLTQVSHRCFISTQSATDFRDRILRQPSHKLDHVIPLGADAFGLFPSSFKPNSREFVVLGSIEPRKNHSAIIDSFLSLWKSDVDCRLTFLGRVGWIDSDFLSQLNSLSQSEPRFQWFQTPSDQFVISRIRSCRATIYPSLGEGYGLPPVESLALGVPVIVSANLPSVQMLPALGQIRLDTPNSQTIESAVLQMLDDGFAQAKYQEVDELQAYLPRWANLGPYMTEWILSLNESS
jgi:glycosyltransferase involved in cell wall biosynthesis